MGLSLGFESDESRNFQSNAENSRVYMIMHQEIFQRESSTKDWTINSQSRRRLLKRNIHTTHRNPERIGYVNIGTLLVREDENIEVNLDYSELASKHLAILANTGSGKSLHCRVLF